MPTLAARWRRRIETSDRPAYLLISDLIADDVRAERPGFAGAAVAPALGAGDAINAPDQWSKSHQIGTAQRRNPASRGHG